MYYVVDNMLIINLTVVESFIRANWWVPAAVVAVILFTRRFPYGH